MHLCHCGSPLAGVMWFTTGDCTGDHRQADNADRLTRADSDTVPDRPTARQCRQCRQASDSADMYHAGLAIVASKCPT
eukprot:2328884-Prymnesium_polylepis.1